MYNKAFTLVELLISMSIFSMVAIAIGGFFLISAQGQRNIIARQNLADNLRFAMEAMARQLRLAQVDASGDCTGVSNSTYFSSGLSDISFVNQGGDCILYNLVNSRINITRTAETSDVTADEVIITRLEFIVSGELVSDSAQPRVTIVIEAETSGARPEDSLHIQLQTTVSARNVDIL